MHQVFKILPKDPDFSPEGAQEEMACEVLGRVLHEAGNVDCELYAKPVWVDPADGLVAATCPRCRARLEVAPGGAHAVWWNEQALPSSWSGGGFSC